MYSNFDISSNGGFVTDDATQVSSNKKKEQVRRIQSVVPLLISHITDCTEEEFSLHGLPVQIADIVGVLTNFDVQSTKATCTIQDHSGVIKAILWLEAENNSVIAIPPVKENCYVRAFGSIRTQEGEKILMILKIVPVDDLNILTNHRLQMIHVKLYAEKLSEGGIPAGDVPTHSANISSMSSINFDDMKPDTHDNPQGLRPIQLQIMRLLRPVKDAKGLSKTQILSHFSPGQAREVEAALNFFLDEGHAYTTTDNEHFKATDSF